MYADDVLIFTNGSENSLVNLMTLLSSYERSSGQLINQNKSGFYLHDKFQRRAFVITRVTGLPRHFFSFTYLGVLIFYGRFRSVYFEFLVDKIRHALEGWKERVLSFGRRITLIKSVLQGYPIYILSSAAILKSILHWLESLMAQFLWYA